MPLSLNNVFREPRFLLVTAWEGIALFARSPRRTQRFCENVALANTLLWQDVLGRPHTRSGQHSELGHSPASARHQVRACRWVTDSAVNHSPPPYRKRALPNYRIWLPFLSTVQLCTVLFHTVLTYTVPRRGAAETSAVFRINPRRLVRPWRLQLSQQQLRQRQLRRRRLCQPLHLHGSSPVDLFPR